MSVYQHARDSERDAMLSTPQDRVEHRAVWNGLTPAPDTGFVRKLRDFDPTLRVQFSRQLGKFIITQPSNLSGRTLAAVVEGEDCNNSGFRQPDMRDVRVLHEADFQRKAADQRILEGEEYMLGFQDDFDDKVAQELRECTVDDKIQLVNTYNRASNSGKGVTAYRQVTPKAKGKVYKNLVI
ncbi:hypothetical protein LCGC14_0614740 [marine sediment metagenome]|uniref:Uncharacterized protein n=1 Tax=marine sediment metagenome TaxID=412755 RepID=A0A0F9RBI1_9ZZZZ